MLKELIHEKINEIFLECQKANNITSGDIYPLDALMLEQIEDSLEALIKKVIAYQPRGEHSETINYNDLLMEQQEQM